MDDTKPADITIERSADIPSALSGQRYDRIAAQLFPEFSRARLQSWIESGQLLADGARRRNRDKLYEGTTLSINASDCEQSEWQAESGALVIMHEDEQVLVIDKPAGLVVHPAVGNRTGTLANFVLGHLPDNATLPRCGIVHRLDKDTSGLMVVAKTHESHASLVRQLEQRSVTRLYRAIACGTLIAGGTIDRAIGRHPTVRTKMAVVDAARGKHAVSHYRIAQRFGHHTELSIKLETGRTHQIRVHMAELGHPLVGDRVYNPRFRAAAGLSAVMNDYLREFSRQALHAEQLEFIHPYHGETLCCESPPPADYLALLEQLHVNDAVIPNKKP